jgi:AcrR family transcriptional regulator
MNVNLFIMGRRPLVTRAQVLAASRRLFAERGYAAVSLAQIGESLGISAAAVLRHAPTKEALFKEAMTIVPEGVPLPTDFLGETSAAEDPRKVLLKLARQFIPFIQARLGEQVATWMHARTAEDAQRIAGFLREPFGKAGLTPPRRALRTREEYFRRLVKAGRLQVKDPQAAALQFIAAMHAYVTLHQLVRIMDPPMPLERYLDTLMEIWTKGAIRAGRTS